MVVRQAREDGAHRPRGRFARDTPRSAEGGRVRHAHAGARAGAASHRLPRGRRMGRRGMAGAAGSRAAHPGVRLHPFVGHEQRPAARGRDELRRRTLRSRAQADDRLLPGLDGAGAAVLGTRDAGAGSHAVAARLRNNMSKKVIELHNIKRDFLVGEEIVHALRGVSFTINEGEFVTIMGTSGSGKSTLLNTLGCLDTPTSGEYLLDGISVRTMSKSQRAVLRNRKIGFVFQSYNLLPKTTAIENVELPLMYNASVSASERRRRAIEALQDVGLGDRLEHKSNQMSGGQMQRVAIARALVNNPAVILADEATGNLDTRTSFEILVLFQKLHAEGRTIIFVTHNPELAQYSSRNIRLRDGHVIEDTINNQILSAIEGLAALPKNDED